MKRLSLVIIAIALGCALLWAQAPKSSTPAKAASAAAHHTMVNPKDLKWKPIIPGIEVATVSGDPDKTGPYVLRLRAVAETKIPPHWHPADEHITVLEGWLRVGEGDTLDEKGLHEMKAGDYAMMPAKVHHYAIQGKGGVLQVHGMGPFVVNWVNPPAAAKSSKK
ncbi:MAG: cupin domain-containing protein [Acidobacteriales bacterium]|nr:cupin domain-containing protein [Terriglobales bacterium]